MPDVIDLECSTTLTTAVLTEEGKAYLHTIQCVGCDLSRQMHTGPNGESWHDATPGTIPRVTSEKRPIVSAGEIDILRGLLDLSHDQALEALTAVAYVREVRTP